MTGKFGELKFVYKMKKHRNSQGYLYDNYQDFSIFFISVCRVAVSCLFTPEVHFAYTAVCVLLNIQYKIRVNDKNKCRRLNIFLICTKSMVSSAYKRF